MNISSEPAKKTQLQGMGSSNQDVSHASHVDTLMDTRGLVMKNSFQQRNS